MGASQRTKGAAAERELAKLLSERLDVRVERNLEQTRSGGADLLGVGPFALEAKRHERLAINAWWAQACAQAGEALPALAYRQSRQPWTILLPLEVLIDPYSKGVDWLECHRAALCIDGFCRLVKGMEVGDVD